MHGRVRIEKVRRDLDMSRASGKPFGLVRRTYEWRLVSEMNTIGMD